MFLVKQQEAKEAIEKIENLKNQLTDIKATIISLRDNEYISDKAEFCRELTLGEEEKDEYLYNCMDYTLDYLNNADDEITKAIKELEKII